LDVLGFINVYFQYIWTTILHVYSSIIISINGLDIMVTLISVYFEYIKISCKIFAKYIMPILKVYPNHLIIFLKFITNDIYDYLYLYCILILIKCNSKIQYYLWLKF